MESKFTTPKYAFFVDWLRYTVPHGTNLHDALPMHPAVENTGEVLKPFPNYETAISLTHGRVDWNDSKPEQRIMVTFTGKDLHALRDAGCSGVYMLNSIIDTPGIRFTRLDVAIDTDDERVTPEALKRDWGSERFQTRARTFAEIKSSDRDKRYTGHTVYVGSRTSEQFLRVYDKAAEQGTCDQLTRIEVELKGHKAFEAAALLARRDFDSAAAAAFKRFFKWSNPGWQDIVSGYSEKVERLEREGENKRLKWLREVALPAVLEAYQTGDPVCRLRIDQVAEV